MTITPITYARIIITIENTTIIQLYRTKHGEPTHKTHLPWKYQTKFYDTTKERYILTDLIKAIYKDGQIKRIINKLDKLISLYILNEVEEHESAQTYHISNKDDGNNIFER